MMTYAPYEIDADLRPRLGLIVLQADETIEDEFRCYFDPAEVRLHISRVPSGANLTPKTIKAMERALPAAASLFPQGARFDAIGYACTSGASLIGSDRVKGLVSSHCTCDSVTDPLHSTFVALKALGAARIGIVSPYTDDISQEICMDFTGAGFEVATSVSFGEEKEAAVAQISTQSIVDAVKGLTSNTDLDAVFLSCTNLRTRKAIEYLRSQIETPVLSSNLSLAWHMAMTAGIPLTELPLKLP